MFVIKIEKPYKNLAHCLRKMKPSLMGKLFTIRIFRKRTILICFEKKDYHYLRNHFEINHATHEKCSAISPRL